MEIIYCSIAYGRDIGYYSFFGLSLMILINGIVSQLYYRGTSCI